jgi:hypothetical protein
MKLYTFSPRIIFCQLTCRRRCSRVRCTLSCSTLTTRGATAGSRATSCTAGYLVRLYFTQSMHQLSLMAWCFRLRFQLHRLRNPGLRCLPDIYPPQSLPVQRIACSSKVDDSGSIGFHEFVSSCGVLFAGRLCTPNPDAFTAVRCRCCRPACFTTASEHPHRRLRNAICSTEILGAAPHPCCRDRSSHQQHTRFTRPPTSAVPARPLPIAALPCFPCPRCAG